MYNFWHETILLLSATISIDLNRKSINIEQQLILFLLLGAKTVSGHKRYFTAHAEKVSRSLE